jgi:hypothetical protein
VKVYTPARLRKMFHRFENVTIQQRQMIDAERPKWLTRIPSSVLGRFIGWNLIVKANKPRRQIAVPLIERARTSALIRYKEAARTVENLMTPQTSLERELAESGRDFAAFLNARRASPRQYVELGRAQIAALGQLDPARCAQAKRDAERILAHEFDLLGSGPCSYTDPERGARANGYQPIDWYLDPVRNLRFPCGVPHTQWNLYEMRPANADVKYPWELARGQHWLTLGQAWALTGDRRFAQEISDQLDDFMEANPVGFGVNWTCTMDVALRAANWCLALSLIGDAGLPDDFWRRAYGALFEHGQFIRANLENTYEVTSNHFLSNVIGLHYLGAEFADLPSGQRWNEFARKALETEIDAQVLPDGADFESSAPYHRLVTELFLGSARLAALQGAPLSPHYRDMLAKMVDYLVGVMRPDGLMPVIGDADDGRLHIASDQGCWNRQDGRHLLAPAALLLGRPDWLAAAGDVGAWEAAWWGFGAAAGKGGAGTPPDLVKLFPQAGVAIARRGGNYLAVTNGAVGTKGFGNHKHNELLGFELHIGGAPLFVDIGSFVYTSDFAARNAFRSTAAHNTLMVDGEEQNEINPEWIFRMFEKADPKHIAFTQAGDVVTYRGAHTGYARLDQPVTHTRNFAFDLASGVLQIDDEIAGAGAHHLQWFFHAAAGAELAQAAPGAIAIASRAGAFSLTHDRRLAARIEDGWVSPSYGVKRAAKTIVLSWSGQLGGALRTTVRIARA